MIMPDGAQPIWDLRLHEGKRPNEIVFISTVGDLNANWVVKICPGDKLDDLELRWVRGLFAALVYDNTVPPDWLRDLTLRLLRLRPNTGSFERGDNTGSLAAWNLSTKRGVIMSWWGGYKAIPLLDIEGEDECIDVYPMSNFEAQHLEGLKDE